MQWAKDDGSKGLLELAWEDGQLHTLPLLISMGVGWRGHSVLPLEAPPRLGLLVSAGETAPQHECMNE
jgi:hypothetical protein